MKIGFTLKKYWHLFWHFRKISLMMLTEYRTDFYFWAIVSLFWTAFNFFLIGLMVGVTGQIGGWSVWQVNLLLGVYTMIDALIWSLMEQNMAFYTKMIFSGELSGLLLKPIDTQFFLMFRTNSFNNVPRFFVGLAMVGWSAHQLQLPLTPALSLTAFLGLLISISFLYCWWFFMATGAFWIDRLENINEIIPAFRRVWQVPRTVYEHTTGFLRMFFISLTLVTAVPSEILMRTNDTPKILVWLIALCLGMFALSRWFLNISLRKFNATGS
jgi:ABC-2 type transport system permease protein